MSYARILSVAMVAASLLSVTTAHAAEQTWSQWRADLVKAKMAAKIPALAARIKANVPDARTAKPADFTYGDPAAREAIVEEVYVALEKTPADKRGAVAAWQKLFRENNKHWAHSAGFEADPKVLGEVAAFWADENIKLRDAQPAGSFEQMLWDTAASASMAMMVESMAVGLGNDVRSILSTGVIGGSAVARGADTLGGRGMGPGPNTGSIVTGRGSAGIAR